MVPIEPNCSTLQDKLQHPYHAQKLLSFTMTQATPQNEARPSIEDISRLAELKRLKDPLETGDLNKAWAMKAWPDIERRAYFYSKLNPSATKEENWYAAERDILKGITSDELKEVEGRIRSMIQHENDLLNHRIQWFLIINGFLLTATATLKNKQLDEIRLMIIIAIVGLLVCISFWFSLGIGRRGVGRLADMWEHYRDLYYRHEQPAGCHQIGVLGWRSNKWASKAAPWFALPIIFSAVWILLFFTYLTSKPTATEDQHRLRIIQPTGQIQEILINTSNPSTNIILIPADQSQRRDAVKVAPKIITNRKPSG
jgi:hypothetical protein